ncbi:non-hydrolyzing UDP-N-acetylglucosamine 2-epimerase [Thermodesulfobacteriota bacterium]
MKIATIVGARPQFIKAAVVSRVFREYRPEVIELLIHTGQHYDANMSDVFFDELEIPRPHYHLGVGGGTHSQNTGRMIEKIEEVLLKEKPDRVLVYGDTDSTLAGALAVVKLHIPVAHVEAGLRSFNRRMPEEINRVLTDHASDLLFAPTETAVRNLMAEGITGDKVHHVGDVMYDAALYYSEKARKQSHIMDNLGLIPKTYILVTIHRPENTDDPDRMRNILAGFADSPMPIVWPMHPRSCKRLTHYGFHLPPTIKVIDPVGYLDMVMLEKNAALIATDSGGVQKEAYFQQVPCITLRDETEWVELIACGANQLVGAQSTLISAKLNNIKDFAAGKTGLYGDGQSGVLIVNCLDCL